MRHFFDPSLLPVTITDIDGNIMCYRTYGLHHYGFPDLIARGSSEEAELLLLDILDRIFSLDFNIKSTWNYNGNLLRLQIGNDGLASIVTTETDEVRIITILNPNTGDPVKYFSKGLNDLYAHPETEVDGETIHGKDMLCYLIEQVKEGIIYDDNKYITYQDYVYEIVNITDRFGNPVLKIKQQTKSLELKGHVKTIKRRGGGYLTRIK